MQTQGQALTSHIHLVHVLSCVGGCSREEGIVREIEAGLYVQQKVRFVGKAIPLILEFVSCISLV
jgi:hypothetical protein